MPRYTYTARNRGGERTQGDLEAADRQAALRLLERDGLVPVSISESGAPAAARAPRKVLFFGGFARRTARLRPRDVLLFTSECSDLLASGMTLGNALNSLSRRDGEREANGIVAALRDDVIRGSSLSEAMEKRPKTFRALYVAMVRAGEASGMLAETLERLRRHYERVQEARERVFMALVYPGIILTLGALTMLFAMVFVVPRFTVIFEELGSTLPLPTLLLIRLSTLLIRYGWLLAALLVAGVLLLRRAIRTPGGQRHWHRLQLRLPLVRSIVSANAFAHFAGTLGALLENGVPVLKALTIVEATVGNRVIAERIREARDRVTDGSSLSAPLAAGRVFPPLLTDMLAVGEQTGDLPGALRQIARRYNNELDRSVKVFTTLLEPILMVLMAALVGFVAISMLLAVFDMTSGLSV